MTATMIKFKTNIPTNNVSQKMYVQHNINQGSHKFVFYKDKGRKEILIDGITFVSNVCIEALNILLKYNLLTLKCKIGIQDHNNNPKILIHVHHMAFVLNALISKELTCKNTNVLTSLHP